MANAVYPKYKEALLTGSANISLSAGNVKTSFIDLGTYTYSTTHQFYSDLSDVVGDSANLGSKTVTDGTFDAANTVYTAISGVSVEAYVTWIDTGSGSTARLVAYTDTGVTGFPVTPNGGDINLNFNASGLFDL